ncbi:semaphorin-5A-like isoform X2 [Clytia hemisphaerica]|uniref:semaphorin-5A-like isoform X2 n=1 Tax=Clytia hemisphaerica TaxID=252671 RepID=UPI0034D70C05
MKSIVNAVWTLWTDWTSCSGSCGTGSQIRTRFCSPPQHGGAACGEPVPEDYGEMIFKHVENRDCIHNASCPGFRMEVGNCTHICHEQNLACNFLMKKNGSDIADAAGIPCEDYTDHEHLYEPAINEDGNCLGFNKVPVEFNCDANSPPGQKRLCDCVPSVPGNWSTWTGFGECNVTCGDGMRNSTRKCDNPVPQNGGRKCEGPEVRYEECGEPKKCPVHGGWSSWSLYSECQGACQYEDIPISRSYIRTCDNPEPDYGGRKCAGDKFKSEKCDLKPCQSVKADTVVQFYGERFSTELKDLNSQKAMDLKEKLEKGIREEYLSNHPQIAEDSDYIKVTVHSFSDGSGFEPKAITNKKN